MPVLCMRSSERTGGRSDGWSVILCVLRTLKDAFATLNACTHTHTTRAAHANIMNRNMVDEKTHQHYE